jgi:ABC-type hemin transport system ATPase subunit
MPGQVKPSISYMRGDSKSVSHSCVLHDLQLMLHIAQHMHLQHAGTLQTIGSDYVSRCYRPDVLVYVYDQACGQSNSWIGRGI